MVGMDWVLRSPVVMLIFNRPEPTRAVFERIAAARPGKLLLIADGPRADRPGEAERCEQARRAVLDNIDWRCEVLCNISETNLGCRKRVSSGLDWAFTQVPEAIILEDDCLPDPTLFRFFDEMLERYRSDERVMMISGFNPLRDGWKAAAQQYHFSYCGSIWGWASWRRAWRFYDVSMKRWGEPGAANRVKEVFGDPQLYAGRIQSYEKAFRGEIDTWDFQWSFARAHESGLSVVPAKNLVSNIGFGADATHTKKAHAALEAVPTEAMAFPIRFHEDVAVDREYDRAFQKALTPPPPSARR
ncbi:MAG TPA: hypothetical protein VH518_20430 [Tepidisphaeraceae bacterium]|jgi:hypothetical protein